jgi:UrcA family protein
MSTLKLTTLAAAIFTCSAAHAADDVSFRFSRGELASSVTINALYERMDRAAERACATAGKRGFDIIKRDALCHAQLLEGFVDQIDSPAMNIVHERQHAGDRIARAG